MLKKHTTIKGDKRWEKMSHRMKDEHGKKLTRSFRETEIEVWLLGGPQMWNI
jgi:hypothetical protein